MSSDRLIVLDCHYLCHRAFHSRGHLTWNGDTTGVIFGFLKDIAVIKDQLDSDRMAFCFEGKKLLRKKLCPTYKSARGKARDDEQQEAYDDLTRQIRALRDKWLPMIGFKNIFSYKGFESDDIMAALSVRADQLEEPCVLVTADSDMYQCLGAYTTIWHPQKAVEYDYNWFKKVYGIRPSQWPSIKAIAGCQSDNVKGIGGVGEKTALKYFCEGLTKGSKAHRTIQEGFHRISENLRLVKLPFEGTPTPNIREDSISRAGWIKVCSALGMRSIAGQIPVLTRSRHLYAKR